MTSQYSFGVTKNRWAQMFLPQRRKLRLLVLPQVGVLAVLRWGKTVFLLYLSERPIKL